MHEASWVATQQKATAVKSSLFVDHGQFMCSTFFHAYLFHNTINGTLRYTNFPRNLSLSTVCLRKSSWLKASVSTFSILSAVQAVRGRPLSGRRFEVPVRSIL